MRMAGRWGWFVAVALISLAAPSQAVTATLVARAGSRTDWRLAGPVDWAVGATVGTSDGQLRMVVLALQQRNLTARLASSPTAFSYPLGALLELAPQADAAPGTAPGEPAAPAAGRGTIVRVSGSQVWIKVDRDPPVAEPAQYLREGRPAGRVTWGAAPDDSRTWPATVTGTAQVGDQVVYGRAAQAVVRPGAELPTPPAPVLRDTRSQETPVPGDHPLYAVFAALARAGVLEDVSPRWFDGAHVASYTRHQLTDFLQPVCRRLTQPDGVEWYRPTALPELTRETASQLLWLCDEFARELTLRGVALEVVRDRLRERGADDTAWAASASFSGRVDGGDVNLGGGVRATVTGRLDGRSRAGLRLGADSRPDGPAEYDRLNLSEWFLETDVSRHLTVGAGRLGTRYNAGASSLFWSDNAAPLDSVYLDYSTKIFGRTFRLRQQTGTFRDAALGRKYVTTRRYEYLPVSRLTLGANMGLTTDRASQAAASMVMPIYFSRFVSGKHSTGGNGNMLVSVDAAYRLDREWAVYGEFMVDDIDVSPSPPKTAQRVGYLGGIQYTPSWALPGTSYRLETVVIPDVGTYVLPQGGILGWTRNGFILGHPYGDDSAGYRLSLEQRVTPRLELRARGEYYRQHRSSTVAGSRKILDFGALYDVGSRLSVGVGYRLDEAFNRGQIVSNNELNDSFYFQARTGY